MTSVFVILAVAAPASVALFAAAPFLAGAPLQEPAVARLARGGIAASLAGALGLVAAVATGRAGRVNLGSWYGEGRHAIDLVVAVDGRSAGAAALVAAVVLLALRQAEAYLHREPGFLRFFIIALVAATCLQVVVLAGTLDLLFFGWELLGLCSFLLISFFYERPAPVRRALRAIFSYRFADLGLLVALLLLRKVGVDALLGEGAARLAGSAATVTGVLLLVTAAGKAGLFPFTGWLARATEGPTPSSALFYAALSVHAGPWLLLRAWPLFAESVPARATVVAVGLLSAVVASRAARTRGDVKGAAVLAGAAQVGLITAEVGLGLHTLALVHMTGNLGLRFQQVIRAPSAIHLAHVRAGMLGRDLPAPRTVGTRLWAWSAGLSGSDALAAQLARALGGLGRALDAGSRRLERLAVGGRDRVRP